MRENGFYIALDEHDEFGLAVALVYNPVEDDIQFSITICNYTFAIGYKF